MNQAATVQGVIAAVDAVKLVYEGCLDLCDYYWRYSDMKHFISLIDYSHEELVEILDRADYLSNAWKENKMPKSYSQFNEYFS